MTEPETKLPIYLIASMHRSGSSLLTRIISLLHMDLGRSLMPPSFDNPRGFWENLKIVELHDSLLESFGLDWTTAGFIQPDWLETDTAMAAAEKLVSIINADFQKETRILIKDPRLTIFLPLWERVAKKLGRELKVISIIRSPASIAKSLMQRDKFSADEADFITLSQMMKLEENLSGYIDKHLIYERILKASAKEIALAIINVTGMDASYLDNNFFNMIESLLYRDLASSTGNNDMHQAYMSLVEQQEDVCLGHEEAFNFIHGLANDFKLNEKLEKWGNKKTFFHERDELVSVERRQLNKISSERSYFIDENEELSRILIHKETHINELKEKLSKDSSLIQEMESLLDANDAYVSDLNQKAIEAKGEQKKLNQLISKKDNVIVDLNDVISAQTMGMSELQKSVEVSKGKILKLKDGIEKGAQRLNMTKSEMKKKENDLKNSKLKTTTLKRKLTMSDKKVQKKQEKIEELESERVDLSNALSNNQLQLQELNKANTELRQVKDQIQDQLSVRNENITHLSAEYEKLKRDFELLELVQKLEVERSQYIENMTHSALQEKTLQLEYYKKHPVSVATKSTVYNTLNFLRRKVPLPERLKAKTSSLVWNSFNQLRGNKVISSSAEGNLESPPLVEGLNIDFEFTETDKPIISIIVPVYNEISQTIACLKTIFLQRSSVEYEVILADDCSPDPFHAIFNEIKGLRVFRNPQNLGFLQNCNVNAAHARGEYIVFLNNDTLVNPGWLENLYRTYFEHGNVGIVGSKLIFPSGELQEAGGIIWEDASGWNWGRGQNPDHPKYNYVRDVDYVSGASFMIRKSIFDEIGGFYEGLVKAYYEDTDCCFRVRELGYRVLYQPLSSLIHIEGLSSGTDLTAGAKKYQLQNQSIFYETWKHVLAGHFENAHMPHIASDRTVKGHVLYIDAVTPEPDKDSGSVDAVNAIRILIGLGYRVHFVPGTNFAHWGPATEMLQKMGVECIYHPFYSNMDQFLKDRGDAFDVIILSRAEINEKFYSTVKSYCPSAKVINNTVDLHYLRMERRAEHEDSDVIRLAAENMKRNELQYMKQSDASIVLSDHEYKILSRQKSLKDKLWKIPLIRTKTERRAGFEGRADIVFIGGYKHPPNIDAVEWLVNDIWPVMRKSLKGVKLIICGSSMPDHFQNYASDDVIIKGYVHDLEQLLASCKMTIAPLRYGAGLKGKVASSIGNGVPCLGTDVAFEGMAPEGLDKIRLKAKTADQFAKLAKEVYFSEERWNELSLAGVKYHNDNYSIEAVSKIFEDMLKNLDKS